MTKVPSPPAVDPAMFEVGFPTTPEEPRWLVENMLPEVGTAILAGQSGSGKSFACFDLAASVVMGEPFAGHVVAFNSPGVLYIAAESQGAVRNMLIGTVREKILRDRPWGALNPEGLPFVVFKSAPSILAKGGAEELLAIIIKARELLAEQCGARLKLVILDTLSASADFDDENSNAQSAKVLKIANAAAQAGQFLFLLVDHMGKAQGQGVRGGSAKRANADSVLYLQTDAEDELAPVTKRAMFVRKVKGAVEGKSIPFDLRVVQVGTAESGRPITSCVVDWNLGAASEGPRLADAWEAYAGLALLKRALLAAHAEAGEVGALSSEDAIRSGGARMFNRDLAREQFAVLHPGDKDDTRRRAFDRALTAAVEGVKVKGAARPVKLVGHHESRLWFLRPEDETLANIARRAGHLGQPLSREVPERKDLAA